MPASSRPVTPSGFSAPTGPGCRHRPPIGARAVNECAGGSPTPTEHGPLQRPSRARWTRLPADGTGDIGGALIAAVVGVVPSDGPPRLPACFVYASGGGIGDE